MQQKKLLEYKSQLKNILKQAVLHLTIVILLKQLTIFPVH